jgi:CheY-like chemotaxis protein
MNKKIMIVDDDRDFTAELKEMLLLSDYDVIAINDSSMAVDEAIQTRPDIILLDIMMPEENGFQVAVKLKCFSPFKKIPLIAMTAYTKDKLLKQASAYGFDDCMRKPFSDIDLISKIEEYL